MVMNMSEHKQGASERVNYYQPIGWISFQPHVVAGYSEDPNGILRLDALLNYPPITAQGLRSIPQRTYEDPHRYTDPEGDWFQFPPGPPPTERELAAAWNKAKEENADNIRFFIPDFDAGSTINKEYLTRIAGEPPEDFYQRIATAYTMFSNITDKPSAHLARVADVSANTANTYIHRARKRGFLPAKADSR
jgi:hypothetical protein